MAAVHFQWPRPGACWVTRADRDKLASQLKGATWRTGNGGGEHYKEKSDGPWTQSALFCWASLQMSERGLDGSQLPRSLPVTHQNRSLITPIRWLQVDALRGFKEKKNCCQVHVRTEIRWVMPSPWETRETVLQWNKQIKKSTDQHVFLLNILKRIWLKHYIIIFYPWNNRTNKNNMNMK